jgi:hypothetical protein
MFICLWPIFQTLVPLHGISSNPIKNGYWVKNCIFDRYSNTIQTKLLHVKVGTENRIFGLDGLRFFSFVFVIYNHFYTVLDSYGYHFAEPAWIDALGHYGMQYFFAGSGFLISFMVMREHDKTGRFRIRGIPVNISQSFLSSSGYVGGI